MQRPRGLCALSGGRHQAGQVTPHMSNVGSTEDLSMNENKEIKITTRSGLDFGITKDIPKFWFDGDPFKSRLFGVHSLITPSGEGFFIRCLRAYKDQIFDQQLKDDVKKFIFQEGQHSIQHGVSNERFKAQGIDVDTIENKLQKEADETGSRLSKKFAMAVTAAFEHITTITSYTVLEKPEFFARADPHIYSLYAWHCVEEFEHRSVCFDVMQNVAGAGYFTRVIALLTATMIFQGQVMRFMNMFLRHDGFTFWQRMGIWLRGLKWLYGRNGYLRSQLKLYLAYFHPQYHPSKFREESGYNRWLREFEQSNEPLMASKAVMNRTPQL